MRLTQNSNRKTKRKRGGGTIELGVVLPPWFLFFFRSQFPNKTNNIDPYEQNRLHLKNGEGGSDTDV